MTFEQFWEFWPGQRKGKQDARKAWTKVPPMMDGVIVEALLAQQAEREAYAKAGAWHSDWPLPATWIRGARWEDEITTPQTKTVRYTYKTPSHEILAACKARGINTLGLSRGDLLSKLQET